MRRLRCLREVGEAIRERLASLRKPRKQVAWLRQQTSATVELRPTKISDPTNYAEVYKQADALLGELSKEKAAAGRKSSLTVHLSPGTPTMQAVWVILGTTRYPVRFIQSSKQWGASDAHIPFGSSFEFIDPALKQASDDALTQSTAAIPAEGAKFGDIVYRCEAMRTVVSKAQRVSPRSIPVLLLGESGTGKELFARAIHEEGRGRAKAPFIAISCGAIPKDLVESELFGHKRGAFSGAEKDRAGAFESAHGGTLFLDELGEMPLEAQTKLLRVLQTKEVVRLGEHQPRSVDVRVIAATNRNLAEEVSAGRFREDLFYRLAVAVLELPPLRQRHGDLSPLIDCLLAKANAEALLDQPGYESKKLSRSGRNVLIGHSWPGNVRELENTLVRAAVWSEGVELNAADIEASLFGVQKPNAEDVLSKSLGDGFSIEALLDEVSAHYVRRALREATGNKTQAAKLLGLKSHQVLSGWMTRLKVQS